VFAIPDLTSATEEKLISTVGPLRTGLISHLRSNEIEPGLPKYSVWPTSVSVTASTYSNAVKIIDFGESFTIIDKPQILHTPLALRPPEVIFEDSWDYHADLWSASCTVTVLMKSRRTSSKFWK
jgi:serine/threonine-protein kinase SRPK3